MNLLSSKDYIQYVKELQAKELEITVAKNADYSGETIAFANFDAVEKLWICPAEVGLLVRMTDKLCRISNLITSKKEGAVKDESINDTLSDLSNYARILNIYILTKWLAQWTRISTTDTSSVSNEKQR